MLCLLLLFGLKIPTSAQSIDGISETTPQAFFDLLDALPAELYDLLPKDLFSDQTEDLNSAVREMSDASFLLNTVLNTIGIHLQDAIRLLATVIGLLLLSALLSALRTTVKSDSVGRVFSLISSLALLSAVLAGGYTSVMAVSQYIKRLNAMTAAGIPLLALLYSMGGNVTAAVASTSGLTVYLGVLETVVGRSIVPFCGICLAFGFLNASGLGLSLGGFLGTFKKHYATLLAFLMMLLLAMLASQTALGASADSVAMRSAKFATGNLIPVVGGSMAELLRTVSAGVQYLRTTMGLCGILLLSLLLLPTLAELFLYRWVWQISASAAELLNCGNEKKLLDEIASLNGYLIAAVSICSSVLLLGFILLMRCASAIG